MATVNQVNLGLGPITTGSGAFVGSNSPILTSPNIAAATASSINFGGTTLTTYIVGTWTPAFSFVTPGDLSVSYSLNSGAYIVFGASIVWLGEMAFTPTFTTASGNARITGSPSIPAPGSGLDPRGSVALGNVTFPVGYTYCLPKLTASNTFIELNMFGSAQTVTTLTTSNFVSGTATTLYFSIYYSI